jgi:hypothetical protein
MSVGDRLFWAAIIGAVVVAIGWQISVIRGCAHDEQAVRGVIGFVCVKR